MNTHAKRGGLEPHAKITMRLAEIQMLCPDLERWIAELPDARELHEAEIHLELHLLDMYDKVRQHKHRLRAVE